ncbi:MAG: DUF3037 domain-containing protein [Litorilinea sp.]
MPAPNSSDPHNRDSHSRDSFETESYEADGYHTGPNALPPNPYADADADTDADAHNDRDRLYAPYEYAFVRVVPYIHRGEYINAGVILFCRPQRFLAARIKLDRARVAALAPDLDLELLRQTLALTPRICAGEGPIGKLGQAESFHWLVAPHNTVVQTSPVHCGMCADPAAALENLLRLVPGEELAAGQHLG